MGLLEARTNTPELHRKHRYCSPRPRTTMPLATKGEVVQLCANNIGPVWSVVQSQRRHTLWVTGEGFG